ncbi:MAG: diacylglycerol kinase family protein [Flavobacteriaceae bacterium]|nr:diacylglycerol kinase family protein [Bacteroidia bacterium]MBT8287587.1 diacylglycerol kinase family protein [Bacteroidia bacterium]NNF75254.1 diacylglycerol kinase family protein [Flavobacteriaceae bacterium]NNK73755.1 diacylglycerol kinase family protein [Flavobacteriaceae bacterium]
MNNIANFLLNRIKSIGYAFKGAFLLISTEASIKVQVFIAIVMTFAGFYYELSPTEWIIQITVIALIIAIEGLNTAIEELADFVHPEPHRRIGLVKDLAAGAVFIFAIAAVIVGGIIYIPKMF